jgi:transposase-like protein
MSRSRRKFTVTFKTKVVLEALKERMTLSELGEKYELHPNQIRIWKREFVNNAENAFKDSGGSKEMKEAHAKEAELYEQIGRLKVDNEWLKKKLL